MDNRKTVLITGASRGIGKAAAIAFARTQNYQLVLNCCHNGDELKAFSKSLNQTFGADSIAIVADVSRPEEVKRLFAEANEAFGGIDILINNAGISLVGLMSDMTNEEWDRILATNLSSCFYCCREAVPYMVHQKSGAILNVSSVWGIHGASCEVAYSATKGGINAFTMALAKELAPSHISVNAIAFGCIDTEMNGHLSEEEKEELAEEIPAGRFASAEEAGQFIFSVVNSNSYLTGQVIPFDGGWC